MARSYYSTADVARLCGVHISTAIRWVNKGKLRAARTPGGVRRIARRDLAAFMLEHGYRPPAELGASDAGAGGEPRADAALESLRREIFDYCPAAVVRLDARGSVLYASEKSTLFLGTGVPEGEGLDGRLVFELPAIIEAGAEEPLRRLVFDGVPIRDAFVRFASDGGLKVRAIVNGIPLRGAGTEGALVFFEDVGPALELEREAGRALGFLRTVIDTANVAIFGYDFTTREVIFNRKAEELSGYTRAEAQRPGFLKKLLPDEVVLAGARSAFDSHLRGETLENSLWTVRTEDGRERVVDVSTCTFLADDGGLGAAVGFGIDVTDQERLRRQLQESNDFLNSVIEHSPFSLQIVDRNGWTVKINRALARAFGVAEEEIVGEGVHNFFTDERLIKAGISTAVERAFDGEIVSIPFAEFSAGADENLYGQSDVVVSAVAFPITQGGRVRNVGIVYEDITEKAMLQRDLLAKNAELESFVYTVAHDLKSPLGVVASCCQNLDEMISEQVPHKQVGMIRRSGERMREFIDGLLSLSRAGRWDDEEAYDTPSATVVKGIFQDLRARFPDQEIDLSVGELPGVNLHPDAAAMLFQNLITNAHKYRHPERAPRISVRCKTGPHSHRFEVRDNGVGIPADDLEKIFDVFYRSSETSRSGTGVGLAIVRRIVERAGGRVWVESRPGEGSTFYFTIPK